jgi:hypothetical protein
VFAGLAGIISEKIKLLWTVTSARANVV